MKQVSSLLISLLCITSCHGQDKPREAKQEANRIGQPKLVKNYFADENTMPFWAIHSGLQDKAGNLWFVTTGEGVYRYDGKLFTNFTTKDGLSNNTVWSVMEDASGNIWFGTGEGASRYDGDRFTAFPVPSKAATADRSAPHKNEVWSMLQDRSGKIWFGTSDGVFSYDGTSLSRLLDDATIKNDSGLQLKMIQCIFQDRTGSIWFCTGLNASEGVGRFNGRTITKYKPAGEVWVRTIAEDKNGDLYFATRHHGVLRYDGTTFTNISERFGIGNHDVDAAIVDRDGDIWVATDYAKELTEGGGLWRISGNTARMFTTKDGLPQNSIWSLVEDREGNIWVGTRNTGLAKFDGKAFTTLSE